MNRYVFLTLALVLVIVVQGRPQHRFRPYQFSISSGRLRGRVSEPSTPVVPVEEAAPAPIINEPVVKSNVNEEVVKFSEQSPTSETVNPMALQFQSAWTNAAKNLLSIPHLLEWVSRLNPDQFKEKDSQKQVTEQELLPQQPNTQKEIEASTSVIEVEATTTSFIEEIASEPTIVEQDVLLSNVDQLPVDTVTEQPTAIFVEESIVNQPEPDILKEPVQPSQALPKEEPVLTQKEAEAIQPEVHEPAIQEVVQAEIQPQIIETVEPQRTIPESVAESMPTDFMIDIQKELIKKPAAYVEKKKNYSRFKFNKIDNERQQPLRTAKTLFSFAPEPQPTGFVFPAYSYSFSHQPSSASFFGR